jgi:tetratricopeptide (TPR) repeat protein
MRPWSVPLLALLGVLAILAPLNAADDPGDLYLQVYTNFNVAKERETANRLTDALQKYRFCASLLEQIQKDSPRYQPVLVDFRLQKCRESIARVQSLMTSETPAAPEQPTRAEPTPQPPALRQVAPPTAAAPVLRLPQLSRSYRLSGTDAASARAAALPAQSAPMGSGSFDDVDKLMGRGALNALKDQIRALQMRLNQEKQANADLRNQLLQSTAREQSALTEVDRWKVESVQQKAQLDQMRQVLDNLQHSQDQLARSKASDGKRIAELEKSLEATRSDLAVSEEYTSELFTKLEKAAQFIEAGEKIRVQLLADRKELSLRLTDQSPVIAKLEKERDAAVAKNETLRKQIEDPSKLAIRNKELTAKLAAAEKQLAAAAKNRDERQKLETGLRAELATVNQTLQDMRSQVAEGSKRIADLEKQLADTSSAAASTTGVMADENALLKSLVARQLAEQAKRQQARKLVSEEMEKLQIRSSGLVDKVNALAAAETPLTPQEKKLFDKPVAAPGNDVDFSIVVEKKTPESDLPEELVARATEGKQLSDAGRLDEACAIYRDIASKAPNSYFAAFNLGAVERKRGNYPQALTAFKRALELKANDSLALTNLGKTEADSGDAAAAVATLQKAVAADSESYLAHFLLGAALNEQGDRDGARREVSRALDLKPDYLPAVQLSGELGDGNRESAPPAAGAQQAR